MKEAKFKAWDKKNKKWTFPLVCCSGRITMIEPFNHRKDTKGDLIKVVLVQYTGVKDRNGHEIYEKDIIETRASKSRYIIVCEKDRVDFLAKNVLDDNCILLNWWDDMKKIGNIYENPELIQKED